ncbi:hypothetical protein C8Q76DRAFT_802001 [Earliella scabrosa]|nr:hypothetical protein C8Q76DRAFT_802001 [Earliella scabrosa]
MSKSLRVLSLPLPVRIHTAILPKLKSLTIGMTPWSSRFWELLSECASLEVLDIQAAQETYGAATFPKLLHLQDLQELRARNYASSLLAMSSIHAPNVHTMTFRDDHGHPGASYLAIIISILRYPNRSLLRQLDVGEVQGVTNDDLTAILWACRGLTSLRFRAVGKGDQRRSGIFQFIQAKCPAMRKVQLVTSMQATAIPLSWRQLCSSPYLECELEHIWV